MIGNATRRHRTTPWLALALLLGAGPAAAGVVTNLSDSGAGSLRDQVNAGGAVTFGVGLTGTINLTSGPISITSATPSISGPGANAITINASGNAGRIFNIVSTGTTTTVSGLTLTGGSAGPTSQGGAVLNNGTLTLNAVAVTSNAASDGGGGIYNTGSLTVTSSLFTGNTVTASTCAGGGAIRSEGPGSSLVVRDSTITANSAPSCNGGGISFNNGTASIIASTITANNAGLGGGNVYKGSAAAGLTLGTSVISDGTTGGGTPANPDLHGAFGGGLTSSGYNLVKARGDGIGYVATDLADGTSSQLSSLTNHGGTTATQLPNIGSPLLDARPAPCPTANDQRGFARPQGTSCDIGAVEYRHAALTATIVGSGTVSAGASPVPLSGTITNCATSCAADYDGELAPTVTLTATPNANQGFTSWSGACSGTNPVTTVAMTAAKTCTATFVPLTYSVTSSVAGGNGSISPLGAQTVNAGATAVFTLTPSANYHVGSVDGTCGGVLSGPNNTTYTTNAVNANCTVVAHFAIDQHVVLASVAGGNGTITPTGAVNVDHGSNAVFSLSPSPNYHVASVDGSCGGVLSGPNNTTYTTAAVTADCTVVAHFTIDQHTVTPSVSGGNGTITPSTPQLVNHGATTAFTLAPSANYHVASVDGSCGGVLSGPNNTTYTTAAVTADCTVVAHFTIDQHTVTPSVSGGNGTITPSTPQLVNHGATTVFTLAPSANYHVASVDGSCGGVLSGPNNTTYTTAAVTADCTVVAHFTIDQHTVTPSVSGGNGTITPSTPQLVNHGATTVFTLAPSANYHVASVDGTCNGTLSGVGNTTYTTNAVTADCTVVAHFTIDQHTVTPSVSGGNGTITPSTPQLVNHGATTVFTLAPSANYHVASVDGTCNGTLSGVGNTTYTTNAVTADCTVVAHFTIDQHTVTPSVSGGNGTITPSTPQLVNHGATTVFTLAPSANYHVASVDGTCNGTLSGVGNTTYTTNTINADCTVVAHFTIDQHTVTPSVAGGNGTITPSTPQLVNHGATTVFTLAPAASHHVASVDGTCNGTLSGVGNTTYTTNAINSDCTVVAHFAIDRHTVGGSVSGLVGSALVLRLNGGNDLLIGANGSFVFAQPIDDLSAYAVTIAQQPTGPTQVCTVANGSGTIAGSDVTNVAISCPAPQAHLSVTVSDGRSYVHYGMLLNYIVTITNDGNGDATGVSVSNVSPPQLDVASTTWTCQGAGGGATCAASGNGALNDNNVKLPIGRTLTWIVTSPVRLDASGGGIGYTVNVTGAGSASATDQDVMVIMRTGMDVPYGDGAESVDDTAMVACTPAGSVQQRFDLTATRAFALPATASAAIDVVLVAHAANGAALRVERLNVGTAPRVRVVATDKSGVEHATAWATTVARATLTLGVATSGDQSVLLLDGSGIALEIVLPEGIDATVQAQVPTRDCGP